MALTIIDGRTVWDQADADTNWIGAPAEFTSAPTPKELSACIGYIVSNTSVQGGASGTAVDLSAGTVIYVWALGQGIMDTKALFGITLYVSDGTNNIGYAIAGSDVAVFRHNDGQPGWQCLAIDTTNLPASSIDYAGSETSLDWTAIEVIGVGFKTLVKAVGGVSNCYIDVIRYGTGGIYVYGGTSGAYEVLATIAAEDASNADGKAYGLFRKLGTQLFGLQGILEIGDATGINDTYIYDTRFTIAIEDAGLGVSRSGIRVQGNSTGNSTIWMLDSNFICPSGIGAFFDASSANINALFCRGLTFVNFTEGMTFAESGTTSHWFQDIKFDGCAQVDPGTVIFENITFVNCPVANGALLLDSSDTTRWDTIDFTKGTPTAHAIYITAIGTYSLENITFNGYGADETTTAAVYNNSGGLVTLNITGGDTPTVRNGTGASTTTINAKYLVVRVKSATTGLNISGARVYLEAAAGGDLTEGTVILNGLTNLGIIQITDFNYTNDQPVVGRVRMGTSTPFYKTGVLGGSITSDGYDVTTFLVDDE